MRRAEWQLWQHFCAPSTLCRFALLHAAALLDAALCRRAPSPLLPFHGAVLQMRIVLAFQLLCLCWLISSETLRELPHATKCCGGMFAV